MDVEQIKKRQTIKVFITETIMVFSIIGLVIFLMMIASGYWISQDFRVERQGLLQYASIPSGADVSIDGESGWMQKTNNSKMVSAGEHVVTISKEGYDSWTKKVNIEEGLLYRVVYPRLFLQDRTTEKVKEIGNVRYATASPSGERVLILEDDATLKVAMIDSDEFKIDDVKISNLYDGAYSFNEILGSNWSGNNEKVLIKVKVSVKGNAEQDEWVLIDVKNPEKSVRISKTFDLDIADIKFMDDSADNLLILGYSGVFEKQLRKINLSSQSISAVLASNVHSMNVFGDDILFIYDRPPYQNISTSQAAIYSNGEIKNITDIENLSTAFVQKSEFYGKQYLNIVDNNKVRLYSEKESETMSDIDGFTQELEGEISFYPKEFKIEKNGDFLFMKNGTKIAVLDMESEKINEYEIESEKYGWFDGHMIYTIDDAGTLIVYDYDGLNRRELAKNVSREFGAVISARWLYYVSDGYLMRENLLPR